MSTIRRAIAASLLGLPLALAAGAGLASADTYSSNDSVVGPDGAATHGVVAGTVHGTSYYHEHYTAANAFGAWTDAVTSAATPYGHAGYYHVSALATEYGVGSHHTSASTGDDDN